MGEMFLFHNFVKNEIIINMDLRDIRREYSSLKLSRKDLPENPVSLMDQWINDAIKFGVKEPTALLVATADKNGMPSLRTVLLKEIDDSSIVFYTNYDSRKGRQIQENPHVAVSMLWHELERQIHIEGIVAKVDEKESDEYFDKRPYKSRIGARISPQSQIIPSREYIMALFVKESLKYTGRHVPRPEHWGGYRVIPDRIEFWQGRESRLHDRFLYTKDENGLWNINRLAP